MDVKPSILYKIYALNQEKIFEEMRKNKISVFDIERNNNDTTFKIFPNNCKKTNNILKKYNAKIIKTQNYGLINLIEKFKAKVALFMAIILCLFAFTFINNLVLKIDVYGTENIDKADIVEFINSKQISSMDINSEDINNLELQLMENFEEISLVSIIKKGITLIVNIKEKTIYPTPPDGGLDIIAEYNGRITSLHVLSGSTDYKEGDLVQKGDILVNGIRANESTSENIKAEAKITMEVWYETKYVHNPIQIQTIKTGRIEKYQEVEVFGRKLYSNLRDCTFQNYQKEESEQKINLLFPLIIKHTIYYEVENIEKNTPFEEKKQEILKKCKENTLQMVSNSDIIKSEDCEITQQGDSTIVQYIIIVEKTIT